MISNKDLNITANSNNINNNNNKLVLEANSAALKSFSSNSFDKSFAKTTNTILNQTSLSYLNNQKSSHQLNDRCPIMEHLDNKNQSSNCDSIINSAKHRLSVLLNENLK
jgi:hypothetical protein